ncbi:MAG TPA: ABC transporter permease [Candidatus Limnocylindrales bacterium]
MTSRVGRLGIRLATLAVLAFLYVPIGVIALYAFNESRSQTWPIANFTTDWFGVAFANSDLHDALFLSIWVGLVATFIALVLGTLAALALHRFRFFGRDAVSFMFVLPIALPGIVTGMALSATINASAVGFSAFTIAVGHATFCIVVVFNNVIARLRRTSRSIEEASMDLGADALQTFRYVTFPMVRTALLAGGLLAFALSFDEIVVTRFTAGTDSTLPIWIYSQLFRATQRPIVNVAALIVIVISIVPVYLAQRLGSDTTGVTSR